MTTDITYRNEGMFTSFMPETTSGIALMNEFFALNGGYKVLSAHATTVIGDMRKAGFTVSKAKKVVIDEADLLSELFA